MALIDKASLLMVPSTYEAGKLYNVLPSGNRAPDSTDQNSGYDQTRADFDFDRGTDHAATRIDENGVLQKYRENLLLRSNAFSTSPWAITNANLTSGQGGHDGSSDAWKLESTTTSASFVKQDVSQSGVSTSSIYLKAGNANFVYFRVGGSTSQGGFINLTNGSVSDLLNSPIEIKATSVGNGWFRCVVVVNTSVTNVRYYIGDLAGSTSSAIGSFIYIQSAQLETGLVATDYLDSTDVTAKAGVLVDLPRINYDANGENGSLLLEPSRQQLLQFSEYFGASAWAKTSAGNGTLPVITTNYGISPEGLKNASRLQMNLNGGTTGGDISYISYFLTSIAPATNSVYLKSLGSDTTMTFRCGSTFKSILVTSEWQRFDAIDASGTDRLQLLLYGNSDSQSADVLIFGAMTEAGSYPSSYIPNHGESGGVTRAADVCDGAGDASTFNSTEGVLYVEASALANDGTSRMITLCDTSTNNHIRIYPTTTDNRITIAVKSNNVNQYVYHYDGLSDITDTWKVAVKYKANDFATFVNGTKVNSSTSGSTPIGMNELQYNGGNSSSPFYGNVNQVLTFNTALSDSELATLTTL